MRSFRDIREIRISAFHPRTAEFLGCWSYLWDSRKAMKGFYSQKAVKGARKSARLIAGYIDNPLALKEPKIRIRFYYRTTHQF